MCASIAPLIVAERQPTVRTTRKDRIDRLHFSPLLFQFAEFAQQSQRKEFREE